ncbi:carbonic anhydrase CynT [Streptomyces phaeofaciens JCM 4814]|uniref:Carbonic anhydrase n=1 Tax=Streptomyces phaeofaciens TaxID=68254 RepID=A0A918M099_9ACTN|nr:carbonic anhydrase [Streptomyces phaeofaciens]GGT83351.1 carbonic anhydrase [Streptomyces phaeofaciens]
MKDIAEGFRRFTTEVFPAQAALFERLATTHQPSTLFIGCSDSRVVPELVTQSDPGELFVIRTAGNLVPPCAPGAGADGVAASIEYAVTVLGVTSVIVCGHSGCGAMTALSSDGDLAALPAVAAWLRHGAAARARSDAGDFPAAEDEVAALVRDNVLCQLANLRTHPAVVRALARNEVTLHGWVYDIASGSVEEFETGGGRLLTPAG